MKGNAEKEKVLKLVRNALLDKGSIPYPHLDMDADVYTPINDDPVMYFAETVANCGGKFIYCNGEDDLTDKLSSLMRYRNWENQITTYSKQLHAFLLAGGVNSTTKKDNEKVGISLCYSVCARSGAIIFTSNNAEENNMHKFPSIFIVIVFTSQIAVDMKTCLAQLSLAMPQNVTILRPSNLLREEIEELYVFTVENLSKK